jgi:TolB-like protein/DNA-binding winged helix-turn-helix (wHTH) protein/Flp pilus assembly protein TadD
MIYIFGDCELDTCLYTLQRSGQSVHLRPKVFRICLYLVEHRDRVVSREELCAQVWPGQFISHATLEGVIRALRRAVGDSGQAQNIIQTLHGYGYRFVAEVVVYPTKFREGEGQLVSMLAAPAEAPAIDVAGGLADALSALQETETAADTPPPCGAKHCAFCSNGSHPTGSASTPIGPPPTSFQRSPRLFRAVHLAPALIVLTLVVLGGWAVWQGAGMRESTSLEVSRIAVLPFLNLSAEANHAYFADGITEEVIAQLSQVRGLTVIARTSVMKYKDTLKDVATIGRELRVGTILEGSVRTMDNHVRVSAQLIDVASQTHLWSQDYERELKGVFQIQRDIATRVVQRLKVQITNGEKRRIEEQGTANLEAYTLYLQGRYARNHWTEEGLRKAITYFEQAIDKDPNYALAYAGIADAYLLLPFVAATTSPTEVYPHIMSAVEQASRYGNSFATVQTTTASAKLWYAWDWAGAEYAFRQALALSPNDATAHRRYAWYLITMGRPHDAIAVMHRAQELNPASPAIAKNVGSAFYFARQYDQAIAQFRATLNMDSNFRAAYSGLVYAYLQKGLHVEALAICQQMLDRWGRDPWVLWDLGYTLAVSGKWAQARQAVAELHDYAQYTYVKALAFAWIAIALGEKDAAFIWLEQAYAEHDPYLTLLNADPVYDNLQADARFTALLQKIGFSP